MLECRYCHKKFDIKEDTDSYDLQYIFARADFFGMDCLNEYEQMFVNGELCADCLALLD